MTHYWVEGMTFDEAMRYAAQARTIGRVGISIFHRHEYASLEAGEGCYVVASYSPEGLAEARREAESPNQPFSPYEIAKWHKDENGDIIGEQLFEAKSLDELLKLAAEQNRTET